jgi:hypothetical protein
MLSVVVETLLQRRTLKLLWLSSRYPRAGLITEKAATLTIGVAAFFCLGLLLGWLSP